MLIELRIKDFILIQNITVAFGPNLNILTGETGAGKSMLLGAVGLLMGQTANKDQIRLGAEFASISAVFDSVDGIEDVLRELGIEQEELLILQREITKTKSVSRINGQMVTNAQLKKIAEQLIRVHGQNEQLELFDRDYQLAMLDEYAAHGLLKKIQDAYEEIVAARNYLESLEQLGIDRAKNIDFLEYQIREIEQAGLREGEDEALESELSALEHQEKIAAILSMTTSWLDGEQDDNALSVTSRISADLRRAADYDPALREVQAEMRQIAMQLRELSGSIQRYIDRMEIREDRLAEVEMRLDRINHLKLKYGRTIEEIQTKQASLQSELEKLQELDERIAEAWSALSEREEKYDRIAASLTEHRERAAEKLQEEITDQLKQLNMKDADLVIHCERTGERGRWGRDQVDIRIATTVGQPMRSLKKVVSGGELSRIMLAIQIVQNDDSVMIFDEVDAGISGLTANVVGQKLMQLSRNNQLICITHLPQIAAYADTHLYIEKSSDEHETVTRVYSLTQEGSENELARLVGGVEINELTKRHARDMLEGARRMKE
ncbi:MAG: DNA repair protein RecN [Bacillota bacterium]|nr:DNA repair protein RecN [Bacillota bacterium]